MIAALLLILSVAATAQFAIYYWRAMVVGVAAQPLSEQIQKAARITTTAVGTADFEALLNLNEVTPGLKGGQGELLAVRLYYRATKALGRVVPQLSAWTQAEMGTCARYVAVLLDQRLQHNLACAAEIRSC